MKIRLQSIAFLLALMLSILLGFGTTNASAQAGHQSSAGVGYCLQPGDVIQANVFQEAELSVRVRISKDGTVRLPLIGSIMLGGLTSDQASEVVRSRYANGFLVNPQVNVTVLSYVKQRFTILGQVKRPGAYTIPEAGTLTLLQAIGFAGDFTNLANRKKVVLKRQVNGVGKAYVINVKEIAKRPEANDVRVLPGDVISIPESLF